MSTRRTVAATRNITGRVPIRRVTTAPGPAKPVVSIQSFTGVDEGDVPGAVLTVTFARTGSTAAALPFSYNLGGGTASQNDVVPTFGDYATQFDIGAATKVITFEIVGDNRVEPNETVRVAINASNDYIVGGDGFALATITTDDLPDVISIQSFTGATEGGDMILTLERASGNTLETLTVYYTLTGGTANEFDLVNGFGTFPIVFESENLTATVAISVTDDAFIEPTKTVVATIAPSAEYLVGVPASAEVEIADNEVFPVITVQSAASITEGDTVGGTASITFTRTGGTGNPLPFSYMVTPLTASALDVVGGYDTYDDEFPAGSETKTITVQATGDTLVEPDETFQINVLPNPQYTVGSPSICIVTIYDDDVLPIVNLQSFTGVTEGSTSTSAIMVANFTRTGSPASSLTFRYRLDGGTATADDLVDGFGTFTDVFPPGVSSVFVPIEVVGDTFVESNETVVLTLVPSEAEYTLGGVTELTASINNDDVEQLPLVAVTGAADSIEGTAIPFYFARSGSAAGSLTFNYSVGGGTASSADIVGGFGNRTATFNPGEDAITVLVETVNDALVENRETVVVTVLPGTGYNVATPAAVVGILDNDVALPNVSITSFTSATEGSPGAGGSMVVTFTRDGSTAATLDFTYTVGGGTATAADLVDGFGTRTAQFAIGSTTKAVSIAILGDTQAEPGDTVLVSLVSSAAYNLGASASMLATIVDDDSVVGTLPQPLLVWDGDSSVSTPTLEMEIATPQVDDVVTVQWATNSAFSPEAGSVTRTVTLQNLDDLTVPLYLGGVVNGLWYYRARHSRGSDTSNWSNVVAVTVNDVTQPVLSNPYAYSASGALCLAEVTTDEASDKLAYVVTNSATTPTAAQIFANRDHTDTLALASALLQVSDVGTQYIVIPNVFNGTHVHFAQRDLAGNLSVPLTTTVKSPIQFGYLSTQTSTADRTTGGSYTFAGVGLGSITNRKIKIGVQIRASTATLVVSVTVAGQSCTLEYNGSTTTDVIKWFTTDANVSASTGDVVVTISGGSGTFCMVDLYEITGTAVMREGVLGQRSPGGSPLETPDFRIWDGGAAAMTCAGVGGSNVVTWAGHTEVYDASVEFVRRVSAYSTTATPQGQKTKVSIADTNSATRRISAISWGPA